MEIHIIEYKKEINKMAYEDLISSLSSSSTTDTLYAKAAEYLGVSLGTVLIIFIIISIWSLVWKGLALWKSATKKQPVWFVILLIVNTVGILEILYIFVFSKMDFSKKSKSDSKRKK